MKTKEELEQIKEEKLKQVTGGIGIDPGESTDKPHLENLTDNVGADD